MPTEDPTSPPSKIDPQWPRTDVSDDAAGRPSDTGGAPEAAGARGNLDSGQGGNTNSGDNTNSAGQGGNTHSGGLEDDTETASTPVPLAGPQADYVLATFVSVSNEGVTEHGFERYGDGWLSAESILGDHAAVAVPRGATVAAALVSSSGAIIDAAVSTCGIRPIANPSVRSVPTDYATIQAALDAAQPGDTVAVAAGVYTEHLLLRSYVKLLGADASTTILDGQNQPGRLIDFTGATAAAVSGFTLRNVAGEHGCAGDGPTDCSGDWYSTAVYADGHENGCGSESSLLFTRNIVLDNDIGFLLYFLSSAVVTNNIFVRNRFAFVANSHQDHALVAQNVFYENGVAITAEASYLSVIGNIMASNVTAFTQTYVQHAFVGCNVLSLGDSRGDGDGDFNEVPAGFEAPEDLDFRLTPSSMAHDLGCLGQDHQIASDPGAFGGPLGDWSP
jgi:hypothetical protein